MAIILQPVTAENWVACSQLDVTPEQHAFVRPNLFSIAQAQFYPSWTPWAIYDDTKLVGFTLLGKPDPVTRTHWILRIMIDKRYQNQGHGRAAMQTIIELLRRESDCDSIQLSCAEENVIAEQLYMSLGFQHTSIVNEEGERLMRLQLQPPAQENRSNARHKDERKLTIIPT